MLTIKMIIMTVITITIIMIIRNTVLVTISFF